MVYRTLKNIHWNWPFGYCINQADINHCFFPEYWCRDAILIFLMTSHLSPIVHPSSRRTSSWVRIAIMQVIRFKFQDLKSHNFSQRLMVWCRGGLRSDIRFSLHRSLFTIHKRSQATETCMDHSMCFTLLLSIYFAASA